MIPTGVPRIRAAAKDCAANMAGDNRKAAHPLASSKRSPRVILASAGMTRGLTTKFSDFHDPVPPPHVFQRQPKKRQESNDGKERHQLGQAGVRAFKT